ncbi:hypothetical protein F511_20585 [Dorcoceras hygrometricum]|uniref:Uncharacterized protein n=1 Tax=Dorcoceras hygrometricum TaxID=472368 RepID=A0A2Z7DBR5_9LAMI|nr:hypothetical protein F511_20585 [Dorcoceras hygrometricum]
MDRIGDIYRSLPRRADVIVTTVGARHKCQQGSGFEPPIFGIDRKSKFVESRPRRRRMRRRPSSSRALVCTTCLMAARRCTDWSTLARLWWSDGRRFVADSRTRRRTVAHWLGDDARWPRACAARLPKNWPAAAAPCLDSLRDDGWRRTTTKRRCWTTREARWLRTMHAGRVPTKETCFLDFIRGW